MKKRLNESAIVNELTGHSAFFKDAERPSPVQHQGGNAETRKRGDAETRKDASVNPARAFDLDAPAEVKRGFTFTEDELDALDDVKRACRRLHDVKTSQYEIVRCAIHYLLEDYWQHGEESALLRRLRERKYP